MRNRPLSGNRCVGGGACAALLFAVASLWATPARADDVLIAPVRDNSIYDESGTLSNGQGPGLFVGRTNDGFVRRALLEFDVAGAIPAGSTIDAVELRLSVTQTNTTDLTVELHRLLAGWGEGASLPSGGGGTGAQAEANDATWSHRFYDTTPWATLGGDFAAGISASASAGGSGSVTTWSSPTLVAEVQSFLDDPASNHGWIVLALTTANGQAKRFGSRENADGSLRPALAVTFTAAVPTGACCAADGSCGVVVDPGAECVGVYQGGGTACETVSCPQPTGACCIPNASATCLQVTAAACDAQSGMFQGDFVACEANLCPVVPTPFIDPLPIPAVAQPTAGSPGGAASYAIDFVQFDQTLHSELPPTTVWGFDDGSGPAYPGPTIEARSGLPVDVRWTNDLRDDLGQPLTSHHLPVDLCPHGATDEPRSVMHLHGAHVASAFDGQPEMTLLPGESAAYEYPNAQTNATLWYHDHALGITRLNVAMGLAGAYVVRDEAEDALGLPAGEYELPMIIQDRSFNADGSIRYPAAWTEHVVGNTILVNGRVWPYLNVDRGKYRLRWVNGSGSRAYRLALSNGATFTQIGSDGGLLPAPVEVSNVLLMPGERVDVVLDFSSYPPGTAIDLVNDAPTPYPGMPGMDDVPQVMRFITQADAGFTAALPASLVPVDLPVEADAILTRDFELQREANDCGGAAWRINGLGFHDIVELPTLGTSEVWRFINRSGLAHPMHMHLVMFRVLDRQPFTIEDDVVTPSGPAVPPIPTEAGYKDTVRVEPNEIVRVVARFEDYTGHYAYHCHILEHEDNEMMRQFMTMTECGDGALGMPDEECDDANLVDGDGCSARCTVEIPSEGGAGGGGEGGSIQPQGGAPSEGGASTGGLSADGGAGGSSSDGDAESDEGCDCRAAPHSGDAGSAFGAALLLGWISVWSARRRAARN